MLQGLADFQFALLLAGCPVVISCGFHSDLFHLEPIRLLHRCSTMAKAGWIRSLKDDVSCRIDGSFHRYMS